MLADHLGSGDYAITRVVLAVIVIAAVVAFILSIFVAEGRTRVLGVLAGALLMFGAVRVLRHWEQVTGAADRLTGPAGGEIRFSEADSFPRTVFGDFTMLALLSLLVLLVISMTRRRDPDATPTNGAREDRAEAI